MIGLMDVEKTMEFILSQQAGFAAHQTEFDERLTRLAAFQDSQQRSVYDLVQVVRTLATHASDTDQKINQLTDKMNGLTDNMNALIQVVDGLVRRENGRPSA
jgi:uncharacterized coiled-coil protein SlyX